MEKCYVFRSLTGRNEKQRVDEALRLAEQFAHLQRHDQWCWFGLCDDLILPKVEVKQSAVIDYLRGFVKAPRPESPYPGSSHLEIYGTHVDFVTKFYIRQNHRGTARISIPVSERSDGLNGQSIVASINADPWMLKEIVERGALIPISIGWKRPDELDDPRKPFRYMDRTPFSAW